MQRIALFLKWTATLLLNESSEPSVALLERAYQEKVLGEDCKTYFEPYYTRFRPYYPVYLEKAAKSILRELARVGEMTRYACHQLYRQETRGKVDFDESALGCFEHALALDPTRCGCLVQPSTP